MTLVVTDNYIIHLHKDQTYSLDSSHWILQGARVTLGLFDKSLQAIAKYSTIFFEIESWIDVLHTNGLKIGSCMQRHLTYAWQVFSFRENLC